jgi:hypothetical protein
VILVVGAQEPGERRPRVASAGKKTSWSQPCEQAKSGGAGYRSLCLMHAKHALYHLSYTPTVCRVNPMKVPKAAHNLCIPPA